MPRPPRAIEDNTVYHVLNRANARMQIFGKEADYKAFENILIEAKEEFPMRILAYCIMPNHWHFVLHPEKSEHMAPFMRWVTQTHTQRWLAHRHIIGQGHVYQGRYKSFPVQEDSHFLQLCRYVERNALRAKLIKKAEDWRWSSAWIRKNGSPIQQSILSSWPVTPPKNYLEWLNTPQPSEEDMVNNIRTSVQRGRPFGGNSWVQRIAKRLSLDSTLTPRGRPRKGT